jgi:hypothetical protein
VPDDVDLAGSRLRADGVDLVADRSGRIRMSFDPGGDPESCIE